MTADAVVLAVPAAPASRLLVEVSPVAAAELGGIEYASMAIATFAFSRSSVENGLRGSGFLVPAVEKRLIKAATFSSAKWDWYPRDLVVVRCSIGRFGEAAELQRDDRELIGHARRDLASIAGIDAEPVDASITRWGGALPQYAVGHVERVGRIKRAVEAVSSLAICGAAYDGVGIPACIASGQAAATRVLTKLRRGGE
jgi:oxygen-dependent protoporphyrinogen oxidase